MTSPKFVICLQNSDYPVSLEKRKIYEAIPDPQAERIGHIRIVDESGEAYLYPSECFIGSSELIRVSYPCGLARRCPGGS